MGISNPMCIAYHISHIAYRISHIACGISTLLSLGVLRRHISAGEEQKNPDELFRRILNLGVGEALLFAPSALLYRTDEITPETLGLDLLQVKVKKRQPSTTAKERSYTHLDINHYLILNHHRSIGV